MTKNYKAVNVYSGYGEMDILSVDDWTGDSIADVCKNISENNKLTLCEDDEEEGENIWEEFYSAININSNGIGSVECGEEGFIFVFEEGNEWFDKIDSYREWNDSDWDKWMELCD